MNARCSLFAALIAAACGSPSGSRVQPPIAPIDETRRVTLVGNTHPAVFTQADLGPVGDDFPLEHLQLVLKRSPQAQAAAEAHVDALHDRDSPLYHQWLTPQQFGEQHGVPGPVIDALKNWLVSHGLRVDGVPVGRMFIELSGTAGQIRSAFQTEIHFLGDGAHFANLTDPSIPAALAGWVVGVHALHNFMPHPLYQPRGQARRDHRTGQWSLSDSRPEFQIPAGPVTYEAVAPADFAAIYDLNPLFAAGLRGAGQTIAVIENSDILTVGDVAAFRAAFGLSGYAGTFSEIHPTGSATCTDPGVISSEGEADLDAQWAGATAPDAVIESAACADASTVFGGLIAIQNLIDASPVPAIISSSFGACESVNGAANTSYVNAYMQAAAEGISVFVAAGDQGAAACDFNQPAAVQGLAVNGEASTPYNVAVGGTDFMDRYDSLKGGPPLTTYWSTTNSATFGSALSYIPEIPWNNSCAGSLVSSVEGFASGGGPGGFCNSSKGAGVVRVAAGSGGVSTVSPQPSWQTGVLGLPTKSGGFRYLPDVSLFSSSGIWAHLYVYCMTDMARGGGACTYSTASDAAALTAGGTSFATPALAGIQAIVNQYTGALQGNPNVTYYKLAAAEYGARGSTRCNASGGTPSAPVAPDSTCIFHDVTEGDTDVPCTGTVDCFGYSLVGSTTTYGGLSTSANALAPAFAATTGWDYATGLGSIDAYNLVMAW